MLKLADIPKVELKSKSIRHVFEGVIAGRKYQENKKLTQIAIPKTKMRQERGRYRRWKKLPSRRGNAVALIPGDNNARRAVQLDRPHVQDCIALQWRVEFTRLRQERGRFRKKKLPSRRGKLWVEMLLHWYPVTIKHYNATWQRPFSRLHCIAVKNKIMGRCCSLQ